MLNWDKVCTPQGMGGLGFKDLRLFNIALLGRQLWRLVHNKETLCYQVLSSKYFPDRDPFKPKNIDKLTYVWSSICSATNALRNKFDWKVGDERGIFYVTIGGVSKALMAAPF